MRRSPYSWNSTTSPTRPVAPSPGSAPGTDSRSALLGFDPDTPPRWGRLQPGRGTMTMGKHRSVKHLSCDAVMRAGPFHTKISTRAALTRNKKYSRHLLNVAAVSPFIWSLSCTLGGNSFTLLPLKKRPHSNSKEFVPQQQRCSSKAGRSLLCRISSSHTTLGLRLKSLVCRISSMNSNAILGRNRQRWAVTSAGCPSRWTARNSKPQSI